VQHDTRETLLLLAECGTYFVCVDPTGQARGEQKDMLLSQYEGCADTLSGDGIEAIPCLIETLQSMVSGRESSQSVDGPKLLAGPQLVGEQSWVVQR
jgi:hypothetical protein